MQQVEPDQQQEQCELESRKSYFEQLYVPIYRQSIINKLQQGPKLPMQHSQIPQKTKIDVDIPQFESGQQLNIDMKSRVPSNDNGDQRIPSCQFGNRQSIDESVSNQSEQRQNNQNKTKNRVPSVENAIKLGSGSYLPVKLQMEESLLFPELSEEQASEMCGICLTHYVPNKLSSQLKCNHKFCQDCITQYLNDSINHGQVLEVKCPQDACNELFNEEDIIKYVNSQQFVKYKHFHYKQTVGLNPNVRWCPKPDCEKYVIGSVFKNHLICECGQEICFSCGNQYHQGLSCSEAEDRFYREAKEEYKIFECPSCRAAIQKRGGCNHMSCYKCKYQFCWLCQGKYSSYHYVVFNVFGCIVPGGQGLAIEPFKNPMLLRVLMAIPKLILTVILIALLLAGLPFFILYGILIAPYQVCRSVCGVRLRRYDSCKYILMWLAFMFLGIFLSPITVALVILSSPYVLYSIIMEMF